LWQVCNDKIQSAEQLKRRNWEGPIECKMCGQVESAEHIFVGCVLAKYGWSFLEIFLSGQTHLTAWRTWAANW
jgi:hypothetical protein